MRLKTGLLLAVIAMFSARPALADHYELDKEHTHIVFYVNHLGFSDMMGFFTAYSGTFEFDPKHPQDSHVDVTLRPNGIRTSSLALDIELRGEHFFNTEKFSDIHFVSTGVKITGENTGDITGDLTLLGVTKPMTLHVRFNKAGYNPVTSLYMAGFNAQGTLKRSDFGMNYLVPEVGDEVRIELSTEGVDLDRKKAEQVKH